MLSGDSRLTVTLTNDLQTDILQNRDKEAGESGKWQATWVRRTWTNSPFWNVAPVPAVQPS